MYFGNENPPIIFEDEDQSLERGGGGEEEDDHTPKVCFNIFVFVYAFFIHLFYLLHG